MATINLAVLLIYRPDREEQTISACLRHRCGTICLQKDLDCHLELFRHAGLDIKGFDPQQLDSSLVQGNTAFLFINEKQLQQTAEELKKRGVPTVRH